MLKSYTQFVNGGKNDTTVYDNPAFLKEEDSGDAGPEGVQLTDEEEYGHQELKIKRDVPHYRKTSRSTKHKAGECRVLCIKITLAIFVLLCIGATIGVLAYIAIKNNLSVEKSLDTTTTAPAKRAQYELNFKLNSTYLANYSDPNSKEYKKLKEQVESNLDEIYKKSSIGAQYNYSEVRKFSQGSVKVTCDIFLKTMQPISSGNISKVLVDEIKQTGNFSGYMVDLGTITASVFEITTTVKPTTIAEGSTTDKSVMQTTHMPSIPGNNSLTTSASVTNKTFITENVTLTTPTLQKNMSSTTGNMNYTTNVPTTKNSSSKENGTQASTRTTPVSSPSTVSGGESKTSTSVTTTQEPSSKENGTQASSSTGTTQVSSTSTVSGGESKTSTSVTTTKDSSSKENGTQDSTSTTPVSSPSTVTGGESKTSTSVTTTKDPSSKENGTQDSTSTGTTQVSSPSTVSGGESKTSTTTQEPSSG